MQTATLIISCASLLVSTATLVVLVVGAKKANAELQAAKTKTDTFVLGLKGFLGDF